MGDAAPRRVRLLPRGKRHQRALLRLARKSLALQPIPNVFKCNGDNNKEQRARALPCSPGNTAVPGREDERMERGREDVRGRTY